MTSLTSSHAGSGSACDLHRARLFPNRWISRLLRSRSDSAGPAASDEVIRSIGPAAAASVPLIVPVVALLAYGVEELSIWILPVFFLPRSQRSASTSCTRSRRSSRKNSRPSTAGSNRRTSHSRQRSLQHSTREISTPRVIRPRLRSTRGTLPLGWVSPRVSSSWPTWQVLCTTSARSGFRRDCWRSRARSRSRNAVSWNGTPRSASGSLRRWRTMPRSRRSCATITSGSTATAIRTGSRKTRSRSSPGSSRSLMRTTQ